MSPSEPAHSTFEMTSGPRADESEGSRSTDTSCGTTSGRTDEPQAHQAVPDSGWSERYSVRRLLGSGAFGTVSLAWDSSLHREVAIKRPQPRISEEQKKTFLHEARLAAKLRHPGIVVVHDVGLDSAGEPFVVYEFLPESLKQRLSGQPFAPAHALKLVLAVAEALTAAHAEGLTHRDLKPANILLDAQGQPRIADFGLATLEGTQTELRGQIAGTRKYMSPEQVRGEAHQLDGRTDLWALGIILYELLTGKHPFPASQDTDLFDQILNREPRPVRQWQPEIPKSAENIVLKLLAKPVAQRYASASDVAADLRKSLQDLPEESDRRAAAMPPAHGPRRVVPHFPAGVSLAIAAAVAGVAIAAVSGIISFGPQRDELPDPPPATKNPPSSAPAASLPPAPPDDRSFAVGVWVSLLQREPLPILLAQGDQQVFTPNNLWVNAQFQALLQLGETNAADYSLRLAFKPDRFDGDVGLFLGFGALPGSDDTDAATLLGVTKLAGGKLVVQPRSMQLQRQGLQYPKNFYQPPLGFNGIDVPADGRATLQVDVRDRKIAKLFLNSQPVEIPALEKVATFPAQGRFGVYVFGRTSSFSNAEIRITHP